MQALVRHWVDDKERAAAAVSMKGITREAYDIVKMVGTNTHGECATAPTLRLTTSPAPPS